ncbi:MAG: glycosyltransferase family 4 protein [Bacteroidia bacterium]|nr:glycosyltransferase family 4 protein [Bacteroidia bacterium]
MKILIVCSWNQKIYDSFKKDINLGHFIYEQVEAVKKLGDIEFEVFFIKGKGILGYLKSIIPLNLKVLRCKCDLVHAHYGLSGMVAVMQIFKKVIITFHGTDINDTKLRWISKMAMRLSSFNIFASRKLAENANARKKYSVISCGVDMEKMYPMDKQECRKTLNFDRDAKLILFSHAFDRQVKNYPLAKKAVDRIDGVELIELKGYTRDEVNILMNACDLILVTSFNESGPLVTKEAMACNKPAVSVDVGDFKEITGEREGYFIASYEPDDVAAKIEQALEFNKPTNGRELIKKYDSKLVAQQVKDLYNQLLS